jgi:hypothetical protein
MKKLLTLILILTLSFSVNSQTKAVPYAESGFIAAFPAEPTVGKSELDSKLGKIAVTSYQSEGDDYMILVSENIYPADFADKMEGALVKGIIDGAKNGAIKNLEAQLKIKYKKIDDEDFLFNGKYTANKSSGSMGEIKVTTLCIVKKNHFYIVMTLGNTIAEGVQSFSKSFNLIENN